MAAYYKRIGGKNYDRSLLELAESSTKGKGDGRISIGDAKKLLKKVKDSGTYTDIEKRTVSYIRDNFRFTKEADTYFRKEIRNWSAGKKGPGGEKTAGEKKKTVAKKKTPAKKKTAVKKKAAASKKSVTKTTVKKKAAVKTTEITSLPTVATQSVRETEQVAIAASQQSAGKKGMPGKPVIIVLLVAAVAFLIYTFFPGLKKMIPSKSESPAEKSLAGSGDMQRTEKEDEKAPVEEKKGIPENKKTVSLSEGKTGEAGGKKGIEGEVYTVQVKDQLTEISYRFYGNYHDWKRIYNANRDRIKDPTLIFPGQKLVIPEKR